MILTTLLGAAMMTTFGEKVTSENCWREYPRPQMVRADWTSLNGDWDYAITSVTNTPGRPTKWDGKIRVPYAIESRLSGVGRLLEPDEFLWYTRTIDVKKRAGYRNLLHFDGVDYRAMVFIGHREVTDVPHEGGQLPFTLDVTDAVTDGANELTVCVWDPTGSRDTCGFSFNSRGKQALNPQGCFYTRVSGIWQSVWMETVPETHVEGYRVVTDIDRGTVTFRFQTAGEDRDDDVQVKIRNPDGRQIAQGKADANKPLVVKLPGNIELWSPESPRLYTFEAKLGDDVVMGYFGMRKIEKRKDAKGYLRFFLNNRPCYLVGTLDQGWWPDGLLTPPSDEAMAFDIRTLKDCGFNMMRKHIKVEPLRYYYLCDKMGLLVIQDLPSGSGNFRDPLNAETVRTYGSSRAEMKGLMDLLQTAPSVVVWNPYNEGWSQPGQFLTHAMLDFVRRYDPTRLVNGPSGCFDWEGGQLLNDSWSWAARQTTAHRPAGACEAADTVDLHLYRNDYPDGIHGHCLMPEANDRRISFLGEFGGLGHPVSNHLWRVSDSWGYGGVDDTKTREGLEKTYLEMMDDIADLAAKGLGGSVYTQTTDVEGEINGIMTYDRKVLKLDAPKLKAAHDRIRAAVEGLK